MHIVDIHTKTETINIFNQIPVVEHVLYFCGCEKQSVEHVLFECTNINLTTDGKKFEEDYCK